MRQHGLLFPLTLQKQPVTLTLGNLKMKKTFKLLSPEGEIYESSIPGELGGNKKAKIYGKLSCPAANSALAKGYAQHRVFFENETTAIAAGYRPCGRCLKDRYAVWAKGGAPGSTDYPWMITPKLKKGPTR